MKTYKEILQEKIQFNNWIIPSDKDIELEYKIEYDIKPLKRITNDAFPTVNDFKEAVKSGEVVNVTKSFDRKISYRSRTKSKEEIISLIKGYASYPEFRNEKTIEAIYEAFKDNKPMKMPFIIEMPNGKMRIMSGNTRLDIAQQLGITPKAILIKI
jgi:type IV secretory pathway VirB9-like protein